MNAPSTDLWKKLDEVVKELQTVSKELVRQTAISEETQRIQLQQTTKVEALEQHAHKALGAISMLRWGLGIVIGIAISGGTWTINSINQLKQDVAIIQINREDAKSGTKSD